MASPKWIVGALVALGTGCANPFPGEPDNFEYRAVLRWTGHGVPHILADNLPSAAFGQGYAFASLNACLLADQIVKVRSERSLYFGPGEEGENLDSDFTLLHLDIYGRGVRAFEAAGDEHRGIVVGYVDGFNAYVAEHGEELPCADEPWLLPVSAHDLMAHYSELATLASGRAMGEFIAKAQPPGSDLVLGETHGTLGDLRERRVGSNGWGIGGERSANGRGMLLANPHFPWSGELKFFENHVRIPEVMDVYGASLMSAPGIQIGFNEAVAWTHTVSDGHRFTMYALTLDPADPTVYMYDGQRRAMESQTYSIGVLGDDGQITEQSRTMWRSHYGPILSVNPQFPWARDVALTVRDANIGNDVMLQTWLAMDRAESLEQFQTAHAATQGIPWVNTISATADGRAWYMDSTPTPNLSDAAIAAWREKAEGADFLTNIFASLDLVLLDGSDSLNEWVEEPGAREPGLVPFGRMPQLLRNDFVFNANDSHWLTNPAQPLEGYSPMHGFERTARSPRTRMNAVTLMETGEGTASGADGRMDFNELRLAALSNRGIMAELLRDQVFGRCDGVASVDYEGAPVDIREACAALGGWNRRLDLDSVGALVWREFLGEFEASTLQDRGALFRLSFDPDDPIATPRDLAQPPEGDAADPILLAIAGATQRLAAAGLSPYTPLGEAQFTKRYTDRERTTFEAIPMHGGGRNEGITNLIVYSVNQTTRDPVIPRGEVINSSTGLTDEGYVVNYGTSFIMTMQFTDEGPEASAFVTYGQSDDPESPYHKDQTKPFSQKRWRSVLFSEDDIASDPDLRVEVIFGDEVSEAISSSP
jgi:acyl-homoserine-lactone acylase